MIAISNPWGAADMQIGERCPIIHKPSTSVAHVTRNTVACRVMWPADHPMWSDSNCRTRLVKRIVITMLGGATEHVYQAWCRVCWGRLLRLDILFPLQPHRISAHRYVTDLILVTRGAHPVIGTLVESLDTAVILQLGDGGVLWFAAGQTSWLERSLLLELALPPYLLASLHGAMR